MTVGASLVQWQQEKGGQVQASAASQHRCLSLYWTNTETQRRRHAVTSRSNLKLLLCFSLLRKHSFAGLVKIAHWWCNLYMRPSSSLSIEIKTWWALVSPGGPWKAWWAPKSARSLSRRTTTTTTWRNWATTISGAQPSADPPFPKQHLNRNFKRNTVQLVNCSDRTQNRTDAQLLLSTS